MPRELVAKFSFLDLLRQAVGLRMLPELRPVTLQSAVAYLLHKGMPEC